MDLLGTKALAEFIRTEMVKYNPHVMADLEAVLALAEKSGLLVDKTDDLVDDLDALVASVPAEWQKLARAHLGAIAHYVRVGTQASLTLQEARSLIADLRSLIADLRSQGVRLSIGGQPPEETK